jgi:hypothetical protein
MPAPVILTAAQAVAAMPGANYTNDPETVAFVQRRLIALGYVDVGGIDGNAGQVTQDTILSFRARNDLPLVPVIDNDFMMALAVALPKQIPVEQANASVQLVSERVEVVRTNWWAKIWARLQLWVSLLITVFSAIFDHLGEASDKLVTVRAFLYDVPVWVWPLLAAIVAYLISRSAANVETGIVTSYRQGTVKNDATADVVDLPPSGQLVGAKINGSIS